MAKSKKKIAESVSDTLDFIDKDCTGPEHNDYYVLREALTQCLSLMTAEQRRQFLLGWEGID